MSVSDVRRDDVEALIYRLGDDGVSPRRLREVAKSVRALYDYAIERRLVRRNPAERVALPDEDEARPPAAGTRTRRPTLDRAISLTPAARHARLRSYHSDPDCRIAMSQEVTDLQMIRGTRTVIDLVGGKWSVDVLYLLANGTRRYSEVFYEVGEISKKTLTQTLRALERDGLISRRVFAEVPVKVEYSLTPLGWSLTGPLMAMYEWAAEHLPDIEDARLMHEGEPEPPRELRAA